MATIARMHVELIARGERYRRDMEKSRTTTEKLRHELTKTRSIVGLMAGAAGFSLAARRVFELGSAAEETASKFRTVFGASTREVQGFIDNFATIAGLSRQQAQEVTATTGSIVQGMGFARQASARFSQQVVTLAGDLSSFNNIPITETSRAIQAALTGEREQLKRLGIVLREADVQQRALAISGKTSAEALTQQEKATATLRLITERAGVAVGDLARTQDSAANRARALQATLRTMAEEVASALLPILNAVIGGVLKFIKGIQIMAAETAVVIARMKFWKEAMFGTMESTMRANDELRRMRVAAEEVKNQIIGLNVELPTLNENLAGGGSDSTATGLAAVQAHAAQLAGRILGLTSNLTSFRVATDGTVQSLRIMPAALTTVTGFLDLYAAALQRAREQAEGLNRAQQKFGAISGALGFLSSIPGLGFLSGPIGLLSGGVSSFFGLQGAFGEGRAHGGPVQGGTPYMVGERGPELFVPRESGTVVPGGGFKLTVNMSAPRGAREAWRDSEWQREIRNAFRELEANGFRAAPA